MQTCFAIASLMYRRKNTEMFHAPASSSARSATAQLRKGLMARVDERQMKNWIWLAEVRVVTVCFDIGDKSVEITINDEPGFIRVVDRNAIVFEVARDCALHRMMSDPCRHHAITLWCRSDPASPKVFRVDGLGSVGEGPIDPGHRQTPQVVLRITALNVRCEYLPAPCNGFNLTSLEKS